MLDAVSPAGLAALGRGLASLTSCCDRAGNRSDAPLAMPNAGCAPEVGRDEWSSEWNCPAVVVVMSY